MGSWYSWCSACFRNCCGDKTNDNYTFPTTPFVQQPVKTVRRISSVGQTLTNENGEEIEMPRHSSILQSYEGVPIPWSSSAITVQPGVTKMDIEKRLKTLPTISEVPQVSKSKRRPSWKMHLNIRKKEFSLMKHKEKSENAEVLLKCYTREKDEHEVQEQFERENKHNMSEQLNLRRGSNSSPNLLHVEQASEKCSSSNYTVDSLTNASIKSNLAKSTTWLHSQSLEDVKIKELEAEKLARQYGLDLALYRDVDVKGLSVKSGLQLDNITDLIEDQPAGYVEFSLYINTSQNMISIFLSNVGGLSGIGENRTPFSVIVKVCILSNKKVIKSSKKSSPSLNPTINQNLTFIAKNKINRIIRVSVYNAEYLGRFDAVGHALISPEDFECNKDYRVKLCRTTTCGPSPGMMQICFHATGEKFHINVIRIYNLLPNIRNNKVYVKISYYCLSRKSKEKISQIINISGREKVEFNHQADFRIDTSGRKHNYFVISLKKRDAHNVFKNDDTIGRVFIGPCFYTAENELTPWGRTILNNETLCHTYKMCL